MLRSLFLGFRLLCCAVCSSSVHVASFQLFALELCVRSLLEPVNKVMQVKDEDIFIKS
jgi:hypothetical protein